MHISIQPSLYLHPLEGIQDCLRNLVCDNEVFDEINCQNFESQTGHPPSISHYRCIESPDLVFACKN